MESRRLRFECLEDRRVLATADLVFLIDESRSDQFSSATEWLRQVLTGDTDLNGIKDTDSLAECLADLSSNQITDVHYGMIGFGQQVDSTLRYAHSQLLDNTLLADSDTLTTPALNTAFSNIAAEGGDEDGWDALEHAIAEYPLRPGAIPIFILVQNDEGRIGYSQFTSNSVNESLTHEGVLAALRSKNAILNVLVAGRASVLDQFGVPMEWDPVFNLQQYGLPNTHIVLGVDADGADGIFDGQHTYYGFDTEEDEIPTPEPTISNALQISYHGSNTGPSGMVQTGKSVLISRDPEMTDGIGSLPGEDANPYRAKNILFAPVDMTGATSHSETPFTISFVFPFFGDEHDSVHVQQDGLLSFVTDNAPLLNYYEGIDLSRADSSEVSMPIIAPLWQDLAVPSGGTLLEKTADLDGDSLDDLVIEWRNYSYPHDLYGAYDTISFQAVLYRSGNIEFHYLDLDSYPHNANDELADDTGGIHATVGIWSGDVDPVYIAAGKYVPGLHSPGGEIETHTHGELRDSYIRMAWDTGGSAWDIGIVPTYELGSPEANQLRDDFVASLASQIIAADAAKLGTLLETDASGRILLALNVGSTSQVDAGDAGIFRADNGTYTANVGASGVDSFTDAFPTVDVESTNSIPAGTTASLQQIFSSARGEQGLDSDGLESISLTIDKLDLAGTPDLKDGPYVVELFFAELGTAGSNEVADNRVFDVLIEGQTVLNDYNIAKDHAKIDTSYSPNIEYDSQQLGIFTGVVKRFFVQVSGNNGLQIELIPEEGTYKGDPLLNGIRILQAGPKLPGDYNRDDVVNAADYTLWRNTLGNRVQYFYGADGSGNGHVDVLDYLIWKANYGATSSSGPSGSAPAMVIENQPPQVVNVIVSGSQSTHDPYSFDSVVGSGEQLRTIPVGGADTLSIAFSEDVNVAETDLDVVNIQTGYRPTVVDFTYDVMTMTATWQFASWNAGGVYLLSLSDAVTDMEEEALDGEWTNPVAMTTTNSAVSEFPSGNGTPGGNFNFALSILPGDGNLDGAVTGFDLNLVMVNFGNINQPFTAADYNGDGAVSGADLGIVTNQFGISVELVWLLADLDGDFDVDEDDEDILTGNYSLSNPMWADGDLNGDNVVDSGDLDILYTLIGLQLVTVS